MRQLHRGWPCLVLTLVTAWTARAISAGDWPQWRGGPARAGVCPDSPKLAERLPADGPIKLWEQPNPVPLGHASPVAAQGRVILVGFEIVPVEEERWLLAERVYYDCKCFHTSLLAVLGEIGGVKAENQTLARLSAEQKSGLIALIDRKFPTRERLIAELMALGLSEKELGKLEHLIKGPKISMARTTATCFDAETGRRLWRRDVGERYQSPEGELIWCSLGTPAIVDGRVYVFGPRMYCLDLQSGRTLWTSGFQQTHNYHYYSSPLVADGVVVGYYSAWDARTGKLLWTLPQQFDGQITQEGKECSSPVAWSDGLTSYALIPNTDGRLTCVELHAGATTWKGELPTNWYVTPAVEGRYAVHMDRAGLHCLRLGREGPELVWSAREGKLEYNNGRSPVIYRGRVYAMGRKTLTCRELVTGKFVWGLNRPRGGSQVYSSPLAADGKLLFVADGADLKGGRTDPHLHVLDVTGDKLRPLTATPLPQDSLMVTPALAGGRLFVRIKEADVHKIACYDLRAEAYSSAAREADHVAKSTTRR